MSEDRTMGWTELLDVLTATDRERKIVIERATETERMALFLLRREGWDGQIVPKTQKHYDLEISKPNAFTAAVQVRNQRGRVHLGQIEKFLDFLAQPDAKNLKEGLFISTGGFTKSVYTHLREENISNLRLAILRDERLIWEPEKFDAPPEKDRTIYVGVFTCKGGVGKTTISAHLAGAFALNGYDVSLVDLDRQQNLRKLLGNELFIPETKGAEGSTISVLNGDEWNESKRRRTKIVVCDCNPEFDANPIEFVRKFDYCIVPTTLNPLGINKNADVIKRTFEQIRGENARAHLFVLINNFQSDEESRNLILNEILESQFDELTAIDKKSHYINPEDVAIRFSKQLLYWGFHLFDKSKPQLAFRSVGRYSYPRMDFLKLVDYLESRVPIQQAKTFTALLR